MQDKLDTSINEHKHNVGFDTNVPKFIDHYEKPEDVTGNGSSSTDRVPQMAKSRGMERFQYFQSIKNKPKFSNSIPKISKDSEMDRQVNFSVNFVDKSLNRLPSEIFDHQVLLTVLDLSRNKFEFFPSEIISIQTLRVLKLDHNKIKTVPLDISKLTKLEILSLGHNVLTTLPPSLNKLTNLRELNFENNLIESFGEEVTSLPNLQKLVINQNRISVFPACFSSLETLNHFDFEWFRYSNPPLPQVLKDKDCELYIRKLLSKCSEYRLKNKHGLTFLEFIEYFSTSSVDIVQADSNNRTMLHISAIYEDISVMRFLILKAPELMDLLDRDQLSPLCLAIQKDKHHAAKLLFKAGASPTKGGGHHGSALHLATKRLNYNMVADILRAGENPNRIDLDGNTPLHHAVILMTEGHAKAAIIAQILLDSGANPNATNKENWTPLHIASRRGCQKTMIWSMSYNMEQQEIHGRDEIFKLNKRGGGYKWTAMHVASYSGSHDIVEILAESGADVFKKSINGYTPKKVINKYGLTLKLMEKYEKKWIKDFVLNKKENQSESLAEHNLQNLNKAREINNASKNKFGEPQVLNDFDHANYVGYYFKTKARMFAPLLGSGPISKRNDEDSFEIYPETELDQMEKGHEEGPKAMNRILEVVKDDTHDEENDTAMLDFCAELDEAVTVETENYKGIGDKNKQLVQSNSSKNVPVYRPPKKSLINFQQALSFEIENYKSMLKGCNHFDINYCKSEIKYLKENILSDKLVLSDKLKLLLALRILHDAIIDFIYQNYTVNVGRESFPFFAFKDHFARTKAANRGPALQFTSNLSNAYNLFDLVPQGIMGFYLSLSNATYESLILKNQICTMLCEIKYFPAIDFLETIMNNELEDNFVRQEASKAFETMKAMLNPSSMRHFMKSSSKGYNENQVGGYSNVPNPSKTNLSQMQKLDKYESIHDNLQTDEVAN